MFAEGWVVSFSDHPKAMGGLGARLGVGVVYSRVGGAGRMVCLLPHFFYCREGEKAS